MDLLAPGWLAVAKYLEENKWQSPSVPTDTPLLKGWNAKSGETLWDVLAANPARGAFMEYMGTFNEGHKAWTDVYPVAERLGKGASTESDAVMMVDVGGGQGHQAIDLKKSFPDLPGRFVVQDLPFAFPPEEQRVKDVEFMVHDFTKEQPIKGTSLVRT